MRGGYYITYKHLYTTYSHLPSHLQCAERVLVLLVLLQVRRQVANAGGEDRHLRHRRPMVPGMAAIRRNGLLNRNTVSLEPAHHID